MAKWGEGDPRWIVEDRPDATNVNNWHWTEKNATPWSKDKLRSLLIGLEMDLDTVFCKVVDIKKIEGEATASNRKAKLIFLYEWELECQLEGIIVTSENGSKSYDGKLSIPNLSDEYKADEIEIEVSFEGTDDFAYKIKEAVRIGALPIIRGKVGEYIHGLTTEFSKGLILPTKTEPVNNPKPSSNCAPPKAQSTTSPSSKTGGGDKQKDVIKEQSELTTLLIKEDFQCPPELLYRALTDRDMVSAFSNSQCKLDLRVGGHFELYGGTVDGFFDELSPPSRIVMRWRTNRWTARDHYSKVTLDIEDTGAGSRVNLRQESVPNNAVEETKIGWKRHYFEAMKATFGFGARLM